LPNPPGRTRKDKHRLTTLSGLAALSLDALSSVAYGPEPIVVVLIASGIAGWPIPAGHARHRGVACLLVISYRQVIAAFPADGGAYAVARTHLGRPASLVAAALLIVESPDGARTGANGIPASLWSRCIPNTVRP
jgi:amino acid transporter